MALVDSEQPALGDAAPDFALPATVGQTHRFADFERIGEVAEEYGLSFPYLYDESQQVARSFGAVCTPDIFVYDYERRLRYRGRIDDNWKDLGGDTPRPSPGDRSAAGRPTAGRRAASLGGL